MLHITVYHIKGKIFIDTIKDDGEVLAQFNMNDKSIDLSVCIPYVGQKIKILHMGEKDKQIFIDYQTVNILKEVGQDKDGTYYIKYSKDITNTEEIG